MLTQYIYATQLLWTIRRIRKRKAGIQYEKYGPTPTLIAEYQEEAAQNQDGLTGLADLSNDKVSELAEMEYEGTEEMAKIYWYNDGNNDYDEYSEWCEKLSDVYLEEAKKIEDAYFASAN